MDKASRLMLSLPRDMDAVLLTSLENRVCFSGFSGEGALLLTRNPFFFFAAPQSYAAAGKTIRDMLVLPLEKWPALLPEILEKYSLRRIAVEAQSLPVAQLKNLRERYPQAEFLADGRVDALISELRKHKNGYELDCIRTAQKQAHTAFAKVLRERGLEKTERELEAQLEYEIRMLCGERGNVSVFRRGSASCESLLFHITVSAKGYFYRMARTVPAGIPSEEYRRAEELLFAAFQAAVNAARPGVECKWMEQAARQSVGEMGVPGMSLVFWGHGIGAARSESPLFSPGSGERLESGMALFLCLRISSPSLPDIAIGDTILVTDTGGKPFFPLWAGDGRLLP